VIIVSHWHFKRYITSELEESKGRGFDYSLLKELLRMLKPYKFKIAIPLMASFVGIITSLILPYVTKIIVDIGIVNRNLDVLVKMSLLYLLILLISWIISFLRSYYMSWLANRVIYDFRERMFQHLHELDLQYFSENTAGKIISRIINDTESLGEVVSSGAIDLISSILMLGGALFIMVRLSLELSVLVFALIPLMVITTVIIAKKTRKAYLKTREKIAEVTSELEKTVAGAKEIQTFIMRKKLNIQEFTRVNLENLRATLEATKLTSSMRPIMNLIRALGLCLILWYGGQLLLNGKLTIGTLIAFFGYVDMFFRPVITLTMFYNTIQAALAAIERVIEFLKKEPRIKEKDDAIELTDVKGEIVFEDVVFGYEPEKPVIKGISLKIRAGERVAIVGPTGTGKTTLINLLMRFYDPQRGRVLIDGIDVRDVKISSLRKNIGYISQEPILFSGTVMDNIKLGREVDDRRVIEVCKLIGLHEFIERLPQGYYTMIREGGKNLSVGQRQLIAFARALLMNPKILIFDEAASSVDPETEIRLQRAISSILREKTCIIIAHRLSMARNVDRIVVMDEGRIVEEGTHEELLAKGGLYTKLYRLQYSRVTLRA